MSAPTFSTPAAAPQRGSDTFSSEVATFLSYISTLGTTELPTFVTWLQQQIALTEAAKGAGLWVTGTAYTTGAYAVSPSDLQLYKATSDMGSSTTDPASDGANWEIVVVALSAGGTGAGTAAGARTNLGLGTIATQDADNVAITGGTINGAAIGGTTAAAGAFTTLAASGATTLAALSATTIAGDVRATEAEAEAGTATNKSVTPLGVRQAFNASGTAPVYACRAWVNFKGTDTVAIRASGNVSSITDNGNGDYTVNFTTAIEDVNYSVSLTSSLDAGSRSANTRVFATGSVGIQTETISTTTGVDVETISVAVFR